MRRVFFATMVIITAALCFTSPTQPFPLAPRPLVPQTLSADSVPGATPEDRQWCREEIARLRNDRGRLRP
jgi:hypothetical protein